VNDWLITADMVFPDLVAYFEFPGEFLPVHGGLEIGERFRNIKANYRRHQAMVDAEISDWFDDDPYEIGDWLSVFTPIEFAMWQHIRCKGLDLWPQLPVGRFFVDFGNPVAKVAIECDGAAYHQDKAKDAARDQELEAMGWTVIRVPGWQCNGRILDCDEAELRGVEDREAWNDQRTPLTSLRLAKEYLDGPKSRSRVVRRARLKARMESLRVAPRQANGAGAPGGISRLAGGADRRDDTEDF
jgi:hypothetical protein